MTTPALTITQLMHLVSPEGQQEIVDFIRDARERGGRDWLPAIKSEFPFATWIADLVANYTADEAFEEICRSYPAARLAGSQIKALHAKLSEELDKPR